MVYEWGWVTRSKMLVDAQMSACVENRVRTQVGWMKGWKERMGGEGEGEGEDEDEGLEEENRT